MPPPAQFDLLSLTDNEVVFEIPEHDFPQRIAFRLNGAGILLGRIEGKIDDQTIVVDFPMTGIRCADFGQ